MEIGCHPGTPYPSGMSLIKICMKRHRINLLGINSKKVFQDIISQFLSIFAMFGNILLAINTVGSMKLLCQVYWYPSHAKEYSIFYESLTLIETWRPTEEFMSLMQIRSIFNCLVYFRENNWFLEDAESFTPNEFFSLLNYQNMVIASIWHAYLKFTLNGCLLWRIYYGRHMKHYTKVDEGKLTQNPNKCSAILERVVCNQILWICKWKKLLTSELKKLSEKVKLFYYPRHWSIIFSWNIHCTMSNWRSPGKNNIKAIRSFMCNTWSMWMNNY